MKPFLLVAGTAVVLAGGGVAAANHYDQYQNKKQKAQLSAVEAAKKSQAESDRVIQGELAKANKSMQIECEKGLIAYAKLPLLTQKTTQKPVCSPHTD
jgi:hypothetical protein